MIQQRPGYAQRGVLDVRIEEVVVVAVNEDRFLVKVLEGRFIQFAQQPDLHLVILDDHAADGAGAVFQALQYSSRRDLAEK